ncbi:MAG: hypothetical protein WA783_13820 [Phormidesmis sp.]
MSIRRYVYAPLSWQQDLLNAVDTGSTWTGKHSNFTPWIAQTYAELSKRGIDFAITDSLPVSGLVLADRDTLGNAYPFLPETLLICAKSDREFHPSATLHVTHNRKDEQISTKRKAWGVSYIDHWPMPNIIPRDPRRGSRLENIAYFGSRSQLADELKSPDWSKRLAQSGLNWLPIFESRRWNDYTNIDLIVAARRFPSLSYQSKGAIKLINGWHAGVPALLAPESAFMREKISEYDFIQINSIDEAYSSLEFLQSNPAFYSQMLERCRQRSQLISSESIANQWVDFFREVESFYESSWKQMSSTQSRVRFARRLYLLKKQRVIAKLQGAMK